MPSVSPQSFNEHGRSTLGARFQYEGLMCALNELAIAVAQCAGCVAVFPHVENRREPLDTSTLRFLGTARNETEHDHDATNNENKMLFLKKAISISIAIGATIGAVIGAVINDMGSGVAWGFAVGAFASGILIATGFINIKSQ